MKQIYKLMAIFAVLMVAVPAGLASATTCGAIPTNAMAYVTACYPANIVNTQATITPTGMQEYFNNLPFNALIGNDVFANSISGIALPCWVETYNSMWCNLQGNTIAGSSSANGIYVFDMGTPSTNFFLKGNAIGEAPQLSAVYAQYDNGNTVFPNFYANFNGISAQAGMTQSGGTLNNGYTVATSGTTGIYTTATWGLVANQILDLYTSNGGTSAAIVNNMAGYINSGATGGGGGGACAAWWLDGISTTPLDVTCKPSANDAGTITPLNNAFFIGSIYWATSANVIFSSNYGTPETLSTDIPTSALIIGIASQGRLPSVLQWMRVRIVPPSLILPVVTYGSLNLGGSIVVSPTVAVFGTNVVITASCVTGDSCAIDSPLGTHLATGAGNAVLTVNAVSLGVSANYYGNDITASTVTSAATFNTYAPVYLLNITPGTSTQATKTLSPTNSPFTWNTYFPIEIYTTSPSNAITYTLTNAANTLASNVLNLGYIPPANYVTANYVFSVLETQGTNQIAMTVAANTLNMNDIATYATCNMPIVQYFPNTCGYATWNVNPTAWKITSDKNNAIYPTVASGGNSIWSNANQIFTPQISVTFTGFNAFTLNSVNNPTANAITQSAFTFVSNTPTNPAPYARELATTSTFDQEFFTATNAINTLSFTWLLNNYTGSNAIVFSTNNVNNVWMANSLFAPPPICLFNISIQSTGPGHITAHNNFLASCVTAAQTQSYNIYLVNSANVTLTQFIIYGPIGYGGAGDTLLAYTGPSSSSLTLVTSYLIPSPSQPFSLPLEGNSQQYLFKVVSPSNGVIYTSPLNLWGPIVTINLPSSSNTPVTPIVSATANCIGAFNITSNNIEVTCTGLDAHSFVNDWNVNILNVTSLINTTLPIVTYWFNNTSSFILNYHLTRLTTQYRFVVTAYSASQSAVLWSGTFQTGSYQLIGETGQDLIAIMFFFLAVAFGSRTKSLTIIFVLVAMWVLTVLQITNFGYETLLGITAVGIVLIYLFESRNRGGN